MYIRYFAIIIIVITPTNNYDFLFKYQAHVINSGIALDILKSKLYYI